MSLLYIYNLFLVFFISVGCSDRTTVTDDKGGDIPVNKPTVFDSIMRNIQESHSQVNVSTIENDINRFSALLKTDGSFSDIDYSRRDQTNWKPTTHLDRLKSMAMGYTLSESQYFGDKTLYDKIVNTLQYWYDKHPTSTNWYMQQISSPQRVGLILILLRAGKERIPATLETKLLDRMAQEGGRPDQPGSLGTGANKLDIATHWVYRGCLTANFSILTFGVEQVYFPLFLTVKEGLQDDFSYQQHGSQLYIGGYGDALISGIGRIASSMAGTPFVLPHEKLELLSKFIRTAYLPSIRGQYFQYNILGRGLSRKNALYRSDFAKEVAVMKVLDPAYADEYELSSKRLSGEKGADFGLLPLNTHFWRSDYTLHQRPGYTFDTRTASIHTARNENGNGENLLGYFLTDGANCITIKGNEYVDIFPVWDWTMIPGITAPQVTTIPKPSQWEIRGKCDFTGGASDGRYGVSTYLLNDMDFGILTQARKAWFYFDKEVVCLGAGIRSDAPQPIHTAVNQCLLQGDVSVGNQGTVRTLSHGTHPYKDPVWVWHNEIGYYFPEGGQVSVSNQVQNGSWQQINSSQDNEPVSKEVFKLWLNHGVKPDKANYAYIVLPNKSVAEMKDYKADDIQILTNTDSVQVVRNKRLNLYGLVFYRNATFSEGNLKIQADNGCVLLLRNVGTSQVQVYIADPKRSQATVTLNISLPEINGKRTLHCTFPVVPEPYAGSTREYIINETTPQS